MSLNSIGNMTTIKATSHQPLIDFIQLDKGSIQRIRGHVSSMNLKTSDQHMDAPKSNFQVIMEKTGRYEGIYKITMSNTLNHSPKRDKIKGNKSLNRS